MIARMKEIISNGQAPAISLIHRLAITEKFIIVEATTDEEVDTSVVSMVITRFAKHRGSEAATSSEGIVHTL